MIAIKRSNGDLYWLDAVLSFSESFASTVTKHQIEDGSSISDHIISENAKFSISGVVSGSEFSGRVDFFSTSSETLAELEVQRQINANVTPTSLTIGSPLTNPIVKLLPDSVRQFLNSDKAPSVTMGIPVDPVSVDMKKELVKLVNGFPYVDGKGNTFTVKESVTIVEFDVGYKVVRTYPNCVCTSLSFKEDANSGDAIYPEMSFEQVRFVKLLTTKLPANVASAIKTQASEKNNKGKQGSKSSSVIPKEDIPVGIRAPESLPTSVSDKDLLAQLKKIREAFSEAL